MKNTLISLAAAALLLSACGKKEPAPAAQPAPAQSAVPADYVKKATYFRLPGAAGGEIDLGSYAGKPVLVMFFTESCPYCRKAAPFIQKVFSEYGPKGMNVVGVCVQDSARSAAGYGKEFGITFPLAYNGSAIARNYHTQGVPYIYLLDKRHEIFDVWEGYDPQYDPAIIKGVETLLAKK